MKKEKAIMCIAEAMKTAENKLHISKGNKKIGSSDNISLPPVVTCPAGVPCAECGTCYALKSLMYPTVKKAWTDNLHYFINDAENYFSDIIDGIKPRGYFRWHVSGDIVNAEYFEGVIRTAFDRKDTYFLIFTKKYNIVNEWIKAHGDSVKALPENLTVIFSEWSDLYTVDNPYNLPVAKVVLTGEEHEYKSNEFKCLGNCEVCQRAGCGCWFLQPGQAVVFPQH